MNFYHINYRFFLIFLFSAIFIFPTVAQHKSERLFHIERNKNQHIVCYDLNIVDGKINEKSPIHIYWLLHPEKKKSDLSFIESKLAYGARGELIDPNTVFIKMNALKEAEITVTRDSKTQDIISIVRVRGKTIRLKKVSIIAKPPHYTSIERVDIYGIDPSTRKEIVESIQK